MLRITNPEWQALRAHAEKAYPEECCGVLLGRAADGVNVVERTVPTENATAEETRRHYFIAPEELVRIQKLAREDSLEIVGFYHSHPDHDARWSETDLDQAHWTGLSYVITAVKDGRAEHTNSFRLAGPEGTEKQFVDEPLEVI